MEIRHDVTIYEVAYRNYPLDREPRREPYEIYYNLMCSCGYCWPEERGKKVTKRHVIINAAIEHKEGMDDEHTTAENND